jgi:hypothetical protein
MAVPDFNTTIQAFREWSKRGASLHEIYAAILLQSNNSNSSSSSATPAEIQQAVTNALAADPSLIGLNQDLQDLYIQATATTAAVEALRVGNDTVIVPVDVQLNDGEFITFKAYDPDFWIAGFSLVLSGECRAELRINGNKIPFLNVNIIQEAFKYEIALTDDFAMYVSQVAAAPVIVTGMVILRRTVL